MNIKILEGDLYCDGQKFDLDDYEILNQLGSGANAVVFKVFNKKLHRYEALKIWKLKQVQSSFNEMIFKSEVQKNARLNINNVVKLYYIGVENNLQYALFEYCEGISLNNYLTKNKCSYIQRLFLLSSILSVVSELYNKGIYHGDLHSENIMVIENNIKILDFGSSIFWGKENLKKRDAQLLFDLSVEVVPELLDFSFFNEHVRNQDSSDVCECIKGLLYLLCFELQDGDDSPFDAYFLQLALITVQCKGFNQEDVKKYMSYNRTFVDYLDRYSVGNKKINFLDYICRSLEDIQATYVKFGLEFVGRHKLI